MVMISSHDIRLSIVIPSYKDPYLQSTIDSLLESSELGNALEVVVTLDGYWPDPMLKDDPRVKIVHHGRNRGMRESINSAVRASRGEYIMRTDEHATFAKGYDRILTSQTEDNWIVTPLRYFLDVKKWKVMDLPPVGHSKLVIQNVAEGVQKFAGKPWKSRDEETKDDPITETMAMQGSCWFMKRSWWDEVIKELNSERYQPLYQDSHEMVFHTWKAGGKLMLNKNTWHAHKHRKFPRSHNNGTKENPSNNELCWANMLEDWEDYYEEIKEKWGL